MRKYASIILIIVFAKFIGFAQGESENFYARLVSEKKFEPISYAHIININNNLGTISDSTGYFNIKAASTDTLLISAISYEYKKICLQDIEQSDYSTYIFLKDKIYKIDEVMISYFGDYNDFKYKLLNLRLPEKFKISPLILNSLPHNYPDIIPGPTLASPISLLYSLLSKEGKSRRKLVELKKEQKEESNVRELFNEDIISRITGLKSDSLINFIKYCNFSDSFIIETCQYNLYMQIACKYDEFKKLEKTKTKIYE
ncbi:MAG: carboxypeptidase-like regulatory domain-containing protein [Bacteroidota bacterium]|nr:carboxypeptidase-like regulatory domain-containing protein [Bacteroidota bacterium]